MIRWFGLRQNLEGRQVLAADKEFVTPISPNPFSMFGKKIYQVHNLINQWGQSYWTSDFCIIAES